MMFGLSFDFFNGGYTVDSPTALWWKQLATAVVFGLGVATMLTLVFTPSLLAMRVWSITILAWMVRGLARLGARRASRRVRDWTLRRAARRARNPVILWEDTGLTEAVANAAPADPLLLQDPIDAAVVAELESLPSLSPPEPEDDDLPVLTPITVRAAE